MESSVKRNLKHSIAFPVPSSNIGIPSHLPTVKPNYMIASGSTTTEADAQLNQQVSGSRHKSETLFYWSWPRSPYDINCHLWTWDSVVLGWAACGSWDTAALYLHLGGSLTIFLKFYTGRSILLYAPEHNLVLLASPGWKNITAQTKLSVSRSTLQRCCRYHSSMSDSYTKVTK